ncbi:MAG TPA: exopolysaccharide biosynthesis polyprenyl glycosylphosphotransferase [Acidimicrobiales bacterium]|nr:exopolysaccharide biosynthesis polyprenyl glycosylphosphotransferase [Acidimicrobiales bacterium]
MIQDAAAIQATLTVPKSNAYRRSTWIRRLPARLAGDLVAVAAGLVAFRALANHLTGVQLAWGLGYVILAAGIDASHVRREWGYIEESVLALKVALAALVLTATVSFLIATLASRILFLTVTAVMVLARPAIAWAIDRAWPASLVPLDLLLVCSDEEHAAVLDAIAEQPVQLHRVVGRLTDEVLMHHPGPAGPIGSYQRVGLLEACGLVSPSHLVLGASQPQDTAFSEAVTAVNERGIGVRSFSAFFEEAYGRVPVASIETSWFLFDIGPLHRLRYRVARRAVDIAAGAAFGVAFLLFLPVLYPLVKLSSRGPLLFRQRRVGQNGRIFTIIKLRTMPTDAEASGPVFAQRGDPRVNRVGRFLRKTRLDELPQGINLLRGEMSLVGPRPERPEFVEQFERLIPFYGKRHLIRPGLTGWAQVHEGYGSTVNDTARKLERDLYYLKHQCLSLDARIMAATLSSVLRFSGR